MLIRISKFFGFVIAIVVIGYSFQNCSKQPATEDTKVTNNVNVPTGAEADTDSDNAVGTFTVLKTSSGTSSSFTLGANIQFQQSHVGQVGSLFIAALLADGKYYFLGSEANQFNLYESGTPTAVASGNAPSHLTVSILSQIDVSQFPGAKIYVGYGIGNTVDAAWAELNSSSRYVLIHTIEDR